MFDRLIELVQVVSKNKVQRIEIIGDSNNYDSLVQQLYKGIQEGKFQTAEDAAQALYKSNAQNKNFKHLQFALEQRLLNTVFFIDVQKPSFTEISKAWYTCQKNVATVHILLGRTASLSAISLAERTIRKAIEFEFTEVVLSLSRILKVSFVNSKKKKKYFYYDALLTNYMDLWQAEMYAEDCLQKVVLYSASKKVSKEEKEEKEDVLKKITAATKELRLLCQKHHSYKFRRFAYMAIVTNYEFEQNYEQIIATCKEAIHYFESNTKLSTKSSISLFLFKMATSYIIYKEYDKAEAAILQCLEYFTEGGYNWYLVMRQYFLLCMHSQKHQKAYEVLVLVENSKNLKRISLHEQEFWKIYRAYVQYFILIGTINPVKIQQQKLKSFRYSKFINEFPIYSKEKRGLNISILIIQILLLLEASKYDDVIDRTNNLNQYCFKYLKKDNTYRSNCFIKMLIKLGEAHFHKNGAIRKAQTYYEKLQKKPIEITMDMNLIEIIPYEQLWEYVLSMINNDFKYPKKIK